MNVDGAKSKKKNNKMYSFPYMGTNLSLYKWVQKKQNKLKEKKYWNLLSECERKREKIKYGTTLEHAAEQQKNPVVYKQTNKQRN